MTDPATGRPYVSQTWSYDGYGVMLGSGLDAAKTAAATGTSLLYSGEQYDGSLDNYYLRARYYNQASGTFNRLDPYSGNLQDPQSLHKYAYCHANPVNAVDPSGMFAQGMPASIGGLIVSLVVIAAIVAIAYLAIRYVVVPLVLKQAYSVCSFAAYGGDFFRRTGLCSPGVGVGR